MRMRRRLRGGVERRAASRADASKRLKSVRASAPTLIGWPCRPAQTSTGHAPAMLRSSSVTWGTNSTRFTLAGSEVQAGVPGCAAAA